MISTAFLIGDDEFDGSHSLCMQIIANMLQQNMHANDTIISSPFLASITVDAVWIYIDNHTNISRGDITDKNFSEAIFHALNATRAMFNLSQLDEEKRNFAFYLGSESFDTVEEFAKACVSYAVRDFDTVYIAPLDVWSSLERQHANNALGVNKSHDLGALFATELEARKNALTSGIMQPITVLERVAEGDTMSIAKLELALSHTQKTTTDAVFNIHARMDHIATISADAHYNIGTLNQHVMHFRSELSVLNATQQETIANIATMHREYVITACILAACEFFHFAQWYLARVS